MHTNILPLLFAILNSLPLTEANSRPSRAILLSQVETLTLRGHGAKTTHRRVSAIPQLKCTSSKELCNLYNVEVMRCTNQGSSYGGEDIEWSCSASLPEELKLGSTEVICEGYDSADDPYVLKGSCGVEYTLMLTSIGQARYPHIANPHGGGGYFSDGQGGTDGAAVLFCIIFVGVLVWILSSACKAARDSGRRERGNRGGWGGWGGWGGGGGGGGGGDDGGPGGFGGGGWGTGNDPPPPYPGTKPSSASQSQPWYYPGFWSGLAGGATAGYLAGRRRNDDRRAYDGGWGGSNTWGSESPYPRPSPAFSAPARPSTSSSQRESTGFGSTRRR